MHQQINHLLLTGSGAKSPVDLGSISFAPWNISASNTKTIEGGIICPSVPLAQIIPAEIFYYNSILALMVNLKFPS